MSGVAGRSGRKAFVPDPEQRNIVRTSTGWGIPQQHICRVVTNPQTAKPLDPKSLRKHFALEIGTGAVEANLTVARLTLATILGSPPPPGTGAITNEWVRADLAIGAAGRPRTLVRFLEQVPRGGFAGVVRGERDRTQRDMKVTLLLSTSGLDESAGTPESVQLLLVGVFGEASNCSDETLRR